MEEWDYLYIIHAPDESDQNTDNLWIMYGYIHSVCPPVAIGGHYGYIR